MYKILQFGMTPNYGGVEAFIMNLYRNINRDNIQFDFWVTTNEPISYESEILSLGGKIIRAKYPFRKNHPIKHYKEILNYFKANTNIIAVHLNKAVIQDIDLLIVAWIMHVPVRIIHSHISSKPQGMNYLEKINQKLLPIFATDFLACSEEARKYLFSKRVATIVYDGVLIDNYIFSISKRNKIRELYNITEDVFLIGNIGRFCKQKNTLFIIDIFKKVYDKHKNIKLLLIGNGELRSQIEEKIKEYQIENQIIMINEIPNAYDYYSAMDMFLFPSLYEGFGMVLLEAQINGLPCVATKGKIPKLVNVTKNINFISLTQSSDVWAKAVIDCFHQKRYDAVEVIRTAGFDCKQIAAKMELIYLQKEDPHEK